MGHPSPPPPSALAAEAAFPWELPPEVQVWTALIQRMIYGARLPSSLPFRVSVLSVVLGQFPLLPPPLLEPRLEEQSEAAFCPNLRKVS